MATRFPDLPGGSGNLLSILSRAPVPMTVVRADGLYVWVNLAFCTLLGFSESELIGRRLAAVTHPEDVAADLSQLSELSARRIPGYRIEKRYIAKSGAIVRTALTRFPISDPLEADPLFLAMIENFTALHNATRQFRGLLQGAPDAIVIVGQTGRIEFVNRSAEALFGYGAAELHGKTIELLLPERFRASHVGLRERFAACPTARPMGGLELLARRKDGSEAPVDIALSPLETEHGAVFVASVRDMSDRKQAETQRAEQQRTLMMAGRFRGMTEMASGIAHEINNPLSVIAGTGEELKMMVEDQQIPPADLLAAAEVIDVSVRRISRILQALRSMTSDPDSDEVYPTALGPLIETTVDLCRARCFEQGIQVTLAGVESPLEIECRAGAIANALFNLLDNAQHAARELAERWVRVGLRDDGDFAEISVTDSGAGIPTELRERIMQPFFTSRPVGQGQGLGLSLTRGIVEQHGGALRLDTASPHTRFVMRLPKHRPRAPGN